MGPGGRAMTFDPSDDGIRTVGRSATARSVSFGFIDDTIAPPRLIRSFAIYTIGRVCDLAIEFAPMGDNSSNGGTRTWTSPARRRLFASALSASAASSTVFALARPRSGRRMFSGQAIQ